MGTNIFPKHFMTILKWQSDVEYKSHAIDTILLFISPLYIYI